MFCARSGKTEYPDRNAVVRAIDGLDKRQGQRGKPYKCQWCGFWHMTSKPQIPYLRQSPK